MPVSIFISLGAELLTARQDIFWLSNLHRHFVKPHVFAVSRTDLLSSLEPNQCCYPEGHLGKVRKEKSLFSAMHTSTKNKVLNRQQGSRVPAVGRRHPPFFRSLANEGRLRKGRTANRIPKSH